MRDEGGRKRPASPFVPILVVWGSRFAGGVENERTSEAGQHRRRAQSSARRPELGREGMSSLIQSLSSSSSRSCTLSSASSTTEPLMDPVASQSNASLPSLFYAASTPQPADHPAAFCTHPFPSTRICLSLSHAHACCASRSPQSIARACSVRRPQHTSHQMPFAPSE